MKFRLSFRDEAEADLDALYEYIAEHSGLARAGRFVEGIDAACRTLTDFPARGTKREDLGKGIRTFSFQRRAVIVYTVNANDVTILRVFYAGRDYEAEITEN